MIICMECGKELKTLFSLSNHIKCHKLSSKLYYDKYLKFDSEGICNCGKDTKFGNISIGYRKYCSTKCARNSQDVKNKIFETCIKRYDVDNPSKNSDVIFKIRKSLLKSYHDSKEEILNKRIVTNRNRYGTDYGFQNSNIKNKCKTSLQNNGGQGLQNPETFKKYQNTLKRKYGVDNYSKTEFAKCLFRELWISNLEIQKLNGEPITPKIGKLEREFLNCIQELIPYEIIRNQKLIGYFPDGYIKELDLILEFDEDHHNQKWCIEKDSIKDSSFIYFGFKVIRITKKDWLDNKELQIKKILYLILLIQIGRLL